MLLKVKSDGLRLREAPISGKPIGQLYLTDQITSLEPDDITRQKVSASNQWLEVQNDKGLRGFTAAWLLEIIEDRSAKPAAVAPVSTPAPAPVTAPPAASGLAFTPATRSLRIRAMPGDGVQIGSAAEGEIVISMEADETTRAKIGKEGEWLHVKTLYRMEGYVAAWYLQPYAGTVPDVSQIPHAPNITGVNLDIEHPLGKPDPARLHGMGWVRFGYNVSRVFGIERAGNQDIDAAFNLYKPVLESYARAGYKVLLVLTHQTYGEGVDAYWPWTDMTYERWKQFTVPFTDMVARIARQYAGLGLVHAYQIWNEMDAPETAAASVRLEPNEYAYLMTETIKAIKSVDPRVPVITGGHTGGPQRGGEYARETLRQMHDGIQPDGIAFHPYGRGITQPAPPYTIFGHIDDEYNAYLPLLNNRPVWITEWGVLDRPQDNPADILGYAADVTKYIKTRWTAQTACLIWYAWAMSMHNGYGLVNEQDQPIQPLFDSFRRL